METYPSTLVYIPLHNYEEYIRECLDSIISQEYPNQRIIVSDNASTDSSPDIVKNEYPMVKLFHFEPYNAVNGVGLAEALEESNCEFYVSLGADDKLVPNFWGQVLPYFKEEQVGVVRVGCYQFSTKNPEGSWWRPFPFNNPLEILIENKIFYSSPIRRTVHDSIGGKDMECFFSDWDFWIRAILQGWRWATLTKPMYWYRRHPKAESYNYDWCLTGLPYTYMRNKWINTLRKYNIRNSNMASHDMIYGEVQVERPVSDMY
jgi:glycosyltransferase involved in cell wall biosynthesis